MTFKNITIQAGWLIDGSGSPAEENCIIEITGQKISSITGFRTGLKLPDDSIDFSECTILPGLIDSHLHLAISGTLDPEIRKKQVDDNYPDAEQRIEQHLSDLLDHGVIAVRDGGDHHGHVFSYKMGRYDSALKNVAIRTPGTAWYLKGRYGKLLGKYPAKGDDLSNAILNSYVQGIDHIKIINSGINSLRIFGKETASQFTTEELKRTVHVGNRLGLKTMVHANGREPVKSAIEAGCHSIEHGFFMGDENLKRMADNGVIWVPTICTMKAYMDSSAENVSEYAVARKNLYHQMEQVQKAVDYGVTIALGTDSGSPGVYHGFSVIEEMKLLMQAGLSLEKAVQCGTFNGFQLSEDCESGGKITSGIPATFVAVKGSPEDLPGSLHNVVGIWIKGEKLITRR